MPAPGFAKSSSRQIKVDALRETTLAVRLEVAAAEQIVEVSAGIQTVRLTSSELATTVTRQKLEFRGEAFNIPKTPSFNFGDQEISSTNFGRSAGVNVGSRYMQFGLYYRF